MAKTKNNETKKSGIVKNLTIATLTFLLLLGFNTPSANALTEGENTAMQNQINNEVSETESTEEVDETVEPETIIKEVEKIVTVPGETVYVEKEVKVPYEVVVEKEVEVQVDHRYEMISSLANGNGTYTVTFACTAEGCNDSYTVVVGDEVEVHTHDYVTVDSKTATCTEAGYDVYACECGSTYRNDYNVLGHDMTEWTIVSEATTEANAVEGRSCKVCGEKEEREVEGTIIIPEIHTCNFVTVVEEVAATCEADGYVTYACECGASYDEKTTEATGHSYGDWHKSYDLRSTTESRECENCGKQETREAEVHVHNHVASFPTAIAATCESNGKEADMVCECGDVIVGKTITAIGHDYVPVDGTSVAPTCEVAGKESDKKCINCEDVITGTTIDPTGHSFTNYVSDNNATEEADGTKSAHCDHEGCDATDTIIDEGSMIVPEVDWKAATLVEFNELGWGFYVNLDGEQICTTRNAYKDYLSANYPELTIYENSSAVWAE